MACTCKSLAFALASLLFTSSSSHDVIHVVAPVYKEYSSIGVLVNSFLAQTNGNWTLTIVSDGADDRMQALVQLYSSIPTGEHIHNTQPDARINYINTPTRANDGGHSPRAFGLSSLSSEGWVVLSGGDNYYCPLFIESLLAVVQDDEIGFVYWDFVLDRKGNTILSPNNHREGYLVSIPIDIGGSTHDLSFNAEDDLKQVAYRFAREHGLTEGHGCEMGSGEVGIQCVTGRLTNAMQEELRRALVGEEPSWKSIPDRYEGYVSASLVQGGIDVGAFAVRCSIAQMVVRH